MEPIIPKTTLHPSHGAIIGMLSYFEVFNFPLTIEEVSIALPPPTGSVEPLISELEAQAFIYRCANYVSTSKNVLDSHYRALSSGDLDHYFRKAKKYSRLISNFPFVRGVYISGSLSKGHVGPDSDIDYFIITKPGRLWLTRILLTAYKKLFLFNSRKYFCINYFVDTDHLNIPDQNRFTATEICFLKPQINPDVFLRFAEANEWVKEYYPGWKPSVENCEPARVGWRKRTMEKMLNGRFGEWLDQRSFRFILKFWKRKFRHFSESDFDMKLRSRRHVSKHHPNGFQSKTLDAFDEKIRKFEQQHQVTVW